MSILYPDLYLKSLKDVPLAELRAKGKRALIFDLDNTITEWNSQKVSAEMKQWFEQAREYGFTICILSNNSEKRIRGVAEQLNVPYVFRGKKPFRKGYYEAMQLMEAAAEETVMLGDQIFTDIWGGNRMKIFTILVEPMHTQEYWGTKITRRFEKLVLRKLKRSQGTQGGNFSAPGASVETQETAFEADPLNSGLIPPKPGERGFTLLEVLVGMLILILVVSLAGVRTGAAVGRITLEQEAEKIAWALREARQTAITTNQSQSVRFLVYASQYQTDINGQKISYTFPEGIDFVGTSTFAKVGSVPTCTFLSTGSPNQGGNVALKNNKGEKRFVIVNAVAGRVRVDTKPPES